MRTMYLLTALVLSFAVPSMAQSTAAGSIAGTVLDPVGAATAQVTIQARSADGQITRRAVTDRSGKYVVADLPAGLYAVSVNVPGLRGYQREVAVRPDRATSLDIQLEEGTQLSTLGEDSRGFAADSARHKPPSGPAPRTVDGKPDLSGVWWSPVTVDPGKPEWLPVAQKAAAERAANNRKDSPQVRCLPPPLLRRGPLIEFVQSKSTIIEMSDDDSPGFHHIYLGRTHPKDPDLLWYGDSVGRWEGDTLIVDRINFVDDVWLDQEAHPHGDKLHVIERYRRPDLGHLEAEITVEDPGVLARPYTFKRVAELAPTEEIREFICNENNSDLQHLVGK
jgi:hypothetical protein